MRTAPRASVTVTIIGKNGQLGAIDDTHHREAESGTDVPNLLFGRPLLESFLFALALAVGLTPER